MLFPTMPFTWKSWTWEMLDLSLVLEGACGFWMERDEKKLVGWPTQGADQSHRAWEWGGGSTQDTGIWPCYSWVSVVKEWVERCLWLSWEAE